MRTNHSLAVLPLVMLAFFALTGGWVDAEEPVGGAEVISLEDQLKTGLKARRPEETEFIAEVARLVDTGRLPRKLVDSTFTWAMRRRQTYPFPAFERALRLQADRLGVGL
jgi:hypothetical protein